MKKRKLKTLELNKKSISTLMGGLSTDTSPIDTSPIKVSVINICNTGCDSPVHTCGIINCNLTNDLGAPM